MGDAFGKSGPIGSFKSIAADYGAKNIRANASLPSQPNTVKAGGSTQNDWAMRVRTIKRRTEARALSQPRTY
jgi:hypothetical protein